jgi:hypothetical protein
VLFVRRSIAFDVRIDFHWLFGSPIWCVRRRLGAPSPASVHSF